ncbi:MAG: hypothetical protein ACLRX6_03075 [Limosilactobacillus pontis]|uniref:hypothetical protein n=1 Tax=Limosilactobacillus pontis TaxID=35787 RepID=UPI0039A29193
MTVSEIITALMDKARKLTGLTDKISIARLTNLMDHFDLHVNENLVYTDKVNVAVTSHTTDYYPEWVNTYLSGALKPNTTYTVSASATTSDPRVSQASIRIWNDRTDRQLMTSGDWSLGSWVFPADGKRYSYTFTTDDKGTSEDGKYNYVLWAYAGKMGDKAPGFDFTTTYKGIKLEYGDLATPLEKVGGVVKALLCALLPVRGCAA